MKALMLVMLVACSGAKADQPDDVMQCRRAIREFYASGHWFNGTNGRRMDDEYTGGRRYKNGKVFVTIDEVANVLCPPTSMPELMPKLDGFYVAD